MPTIDNHDEALALLLEMTNQHLAHGDCICHAYMSTGEDVTHYLEKLGYLSHIKGDCYAWTGKIWPGYKPAARVDLDEGVEA